MNHAVARPLPAFELARWSFLFIPLMLLMYLVALDQGAVSQAGSYLHELMHDGRHLLGVPCH